MNFRHIPTRKICLGLTLVGFLATAPAGVLAQASSASANHAPTKDHYFAYIGTYTGPNSKGIYAYRFETRSGQFTPIGVAAEVVNPSFLATDPTHRFLYAVTEIGNNGREHAYVSSFAINRQTGALKFLNKVDSGGGGACHLIVDKTGKILFVANYGSGNVASFAIKPNGALGEQTGFDQHKGSSIDSRRQKGPHAHAVALSSDNRFLFVPDLGTDHVNVYRVDAAKGTFTANDPAFASVKPGLGPRHFTFGAGDRFAYVLTEMGSSVAVFSYNKSKGVLTPVQTISNLSPDFKGEDNSAEIEVDQSGRFLYTSNRGSDTITVFSINREKGTLSRAQVIPSGGKIPRNFAIDPSGKYMAVANQKSDNVVVFAIDHKNGKLTRTKQEFNVSSPICIIFVPAS